MVPRLKYCRNGSCLTSYTSEKTFGSVFYEGDWFRSEVEQRLRTLRYQMISERQPLPSNDLYEAKTRKLVDEAPYSFAGRTLIYIETLAGGMYEVLQLATLGLFNVLPKYRASSIQTEIEKGLEI
jgi:hypothetical protein